jgi:hypothetical protein
MISNQIFKAPTGQIYDPSERIDRSFQRLGKRVSDTMTAESERLQAEQAAFGEMYANLGEIEGKLQEEYAGIHQQMIDNTREMVKQQYKSGKGINDVEFQSQLGQKLGRIRAGMANADNIIKGINEWADVIKNDASILDEDKGKAMTELLSMARNPDVLISKNPFDGSAIVDKYVNSGKVYEDALKRMPNDGSFENLYEDEKGNLRKTSIIFNRLIPKDNPTLEDGSPNIVVPADFLQDVLEGKMGNRILQIAEKDRKERYDDLPYDVGIARALRDGFRLAAGSNFKDTILETAEQRRARANQESMQKESLALQRERFSKGKKEEEEYNNLYSEFVEGIKTGNNAILGKFQVPGKGVKVSWIKSGDVAASRAKKAIDEQAPEYTFEEWKNNSVVSKNERRRLLNELGEQPTESAVFGVFESDSKGSYDKYIKARKEAIKKAQEEAKSTAGNNVVGVLINEREGTGAKSNWKPTPLLWEDDPSIIPSVFEQLDNFRRQIKGSGESTLPVPDLGTVKTTKQTESEEDPFDLTGDF